jgi:uncharacterized protein YjbI with pentapeptide repeats
MADTDRQRARLTPEELTRVLADHARWVESGGSRWFEEPPARGGARADLRGKDLSGAELQDRDLRGAAAGYVDFSNANLASANLACAYFKGATFAGAILEQSDLREAHLEAATFEGAKLWKADLHGTVLRNADLSMAQGMEGGQLAGADLTLAKLPEDIKKFEGLKVVEEASKNAQKILFTVLLACTYAWLTIASTQDAALLLNSATSTLPIIGTDVPIVGFYVIAPIVLLSTYLYLHVYLQRLWEGLASLPAVFPDGRPLDHRAYPWMATGLVRNHFPFLRADLPRFSKLQQVLTVLLLWAVVPITEVGLWARYLPRHEWWGTAITIGALMATLVFGLASYLNSRATLRGIKLGPLRLRAAAADLADLRGAALAACILGVVGISLLAVNGPRISVAGYWPYANLRGATLSLKLDGWTPDTTDQVLGANLAGWNLRFASMSGAFLVKADLSGADLTGARLESADLRQANLTSATLEHADMFGTNLREARLLFANLRGARFLDIRPDPVRMPRRVNASRGGGSSSWGGNTDITQADFTAADLSGANLEGWFLTETDRVTFTGANLYGVSNPSPFLEVALRGGAVCMESRLDWNAIAHGVVEIPEVPLGTDLQAHCHVNNPRPRTAAPPKQ